VPWARPGSRFTLLFEQAALVLVREMPILAAARFIGITDKRLWRLIAHYVRRAVTELDLGSLRAVGLDETASTHLGRNGFAEGSGVEARLGGREVSFWTGGRDVAHRWIQPRETTMSPLRARMIDAMTLAGLAQGTQESYVGAVRKLAAFYRRSPDQLSEEEVRAYLLDLRRRGAARGTFEIARAGLRFLFCQTLDRVWALFGEKKDRPAAAEATA
jgi:hypothetical protein